MNVILDILLLALAVFAMWKLRSALGRRTGFETTKTPRPLGEPNSKTENLILNKIIVKTKQPISLVDEILPEAKSNITLLEQLNKDFVVKDFFGGVRAAYKIIVESFGKGDIDVFKDLVYKNIAERFQAEIERRRYNNHSNFVEVKSITAARIIKAVAPDETELSKTDAQIVVEMESQQLAWIQDEEGRIIAGDPNTPRQMKDIWTFAKKLNSPNPNWFLVATSK